jgi:hypothetical protein
MMPGREVLEGQAGNCITILISRLCGELSNQIIEQTEINRKCNELLGESIQVICKIEHEANERRADEAIETAEHWRENDGFVKRHE